MGLEPCYADRHDAWRKLARALAHEGGPALVVVGLACGGAVVAFEVARLLGAPFDVVAVRKVRHPWQPEYALGAVAAGGVSYVRARDGLSAEQVAAAVAEAEQQAARLEARLHERRAPLDLAGRTVLLVDDGLATGSTMIAAARRARAAGAARIVVAVPVASVTGLDLVRREVDAVVCPHGRLHFFAVGVWYGSFTEVSEETVIDLLDESLGGNPQTGSVGSPMQAAAGGRTMPLPSHRLARRAGARKGEARDHTGAHGRADEKPARLRADHT